MEAEAEAGVTAELVAEAAADELAVAGAAAAVVAEDGRRPRSSMSRMRGA